MRLWVGAVLLLVAGVVMGQAIAQRRVPPADATLSPSGGDDTPAWNAACAAIPAGGAGRIAFGAGSFQAASPWVCDGRGLTVSGAGEGVTTILPTHSGTALSLSPSSVAQRVTVRDLTLQAAGPCATAQALSIVHPPAPSDSYLLPTTIVRDVEMVSASEGTSGCHPRSFLSALNLHGSWNSQISNVAATGPYQIPPVPGTSGIRYSRLENVEFDHVTMNVFDNGIQQDDYAEGLVFNFPNMIAVNTGWKIIPTAITSSGYNGLSFAWNNAECLSVVRCLDMQKISRGWVHQGRFTFRVTGAQDVHILLQDSEGWMIDDNAFEEGANATGEGFRVLGPGGVLNTIHDNSCVNISRCGSFGPGTSANVAKDNTQPQNWPGPASPSGNGGVFSDAGTGNFMNWIGGPGTIAGVRR